MLLLLTGCSEQDYSLEITRACQDGCTMAYGYNLNTNLIDVDYNISNKIVRCIFECNEKYYYKEFK